MSNSIIHFILCFFSDPRHFLCCVSPLYYFQYNILYQYICGIHVNKIRVVKCGFHIAYLSGWFTQFLSAKWNGLDFGGSKWLNTESLLLCFILVFSLVCGSFLQVLPLVTPFFPFLVHTFHCLLISEWYFHAFLFLQFLYLLHLLS